MPIHDWSRVPASVFHDFHHGWIHEITHALNREVLPPGFYAMTEPPWARGPSRLAAGCGDDEGPWGRDLPAPPEPIHLGVAFGEPSHLEESAIVIREAEGDEVVAMIEMISVGHRASRAAIGRLVARAHERYVAGIHLLVIDVHPPGPHDPLGINGAILDGMASDRYLPRPDMPPTVASYEIARHINAYVEPVAVGGALPDRPLFLEPGRSVPIRLESIYRSAFDAMPLRWREVLQPGG